MYILNSKDLKEHQKLVREEEEKTKQLPLCHPQPPEYPYVHILYLSMEQKVSKPILHIETHAFYE